MNSRKAKILKKLMKDRGEYSDTPEYVKINERETPIPSVEQGQIVYNPLKSATVINKSKHAYRKAKKLYDQGLLKV